MKRNGFVFGLLLLLGAQVFTPGAGLIIVQDPAAHQPPVYPPPWPRPPAWPHPPVLPRPIFQFTALEVQSLQASVRIKDQVAETKIEQVFYNPNSSQLEGTFILPLPQGAHLKNFRMEVNGQMVDAELLDADKARKTYEDIVRTMKDPALLEYVGQDLLKVRIFPIEPRATKEIQLTYSQLLVADGGLVSYTLPLNVAKYCSAPVQNFSLKLELESRTPLKTLYSPTHEIEVLRHTTKSATIGLEEKEIRPDKDFQFFHSADPGEVAMNFLAHKKEGEEGYFLLIASPGIDPAARRVPKDVVFVLDTSGSMSGSKIEQAREALLYCVNSLDEEDRFEVVRFATEAVPLFKSMSRATRDNRDRAREFVEGMRAAGGTAIHEALQMALGLRREDSSRPFMIVFLTDGQPTVGPRGEDEIVAAVKSGNKGSARVFCFGLGTDVNTHLLDKIAEETSAITQYVLPSEDIEIKVSTFFERISEPVLAGLNLDFKGITASKVHPGKLPDLFKGQQLIVLGRYTGSGQTTARLTGQAGEEKKEFSWNLNFPKAESGHDFIARLWATRRVGYLLDETRLHGKSKELEEEITELAKLHGIVTPYTSFLVVEDQPVTVGGRFRPSAEATPRLGRFPESSPPPARPALAPLQEKVGDGAVLNSRYSLALRSAEGTSVAAQAGRELVLGAGVRSEAGSATRPVQTAGGKTFYLEAEGWVDSSAAGIENPKVKQLRFGSSEYYDLAAKSPEVRAWLALGTRVKFLLDGTLYEILPSEN